MIRQRAARLEDFEVWLLTLLAIPVVLLVHGCFDAVIWGTRPAIQWVVCGVLAAAALRLPPAIAEEPAQ
ncbi:MAG: hypothetical protein JXB38_20520 [Anaerolineales bacterium]|nr:hypothetical protein [Anaerolineales bacterium]